MKFYTFIVILALTILISNPLYAGQSYSKIGEITTTSGTFSVQHANSPQWFAGYVKMTSYLYDIIKTDSNSYVDLQFANGSLIGINQNTTIQITGKTEVTDLTQKSILQSIIVKSGEIWAKITKQQEEIQFQTNGGVIAIKGTEFVIEEHPEKEETIVSVLDGQITYKDKNNQETLCNPGDKITIPLKALLVIKKYEPKILRKEYEEKFKKLRDAINKGMEVISNLKKDGKIFSKYLTLPRLQRVGDKLQTVNDNLQTVDERLQNLQNKFPGIDISKPGTKGKFPYKISPDQIKIATAIPTFTWEKVKNASNYWIFLSEKENMEELIWNKKVNTLSATYPAEAPQLMPGGKYYWRLIALDDKDTPIGIPCQTYFIVNENIKLPYNIKNLYPSGETSFYNNCLGFYWTKAPVQSTYKLTISESQDMSTPIISETTEEECYTVPEAKKDIFTPGKFYYWQVQCIDKNNNPEGQPSSVTRFKLK